MRLPNKQYARIEYLGDTQHEDILPSVFEYLGFNIPKDVQGESFASVMKEGFKGNSRTYSFYEYQDYALGVSKGPWKLLYYPPKSWPFRKFPQIDNTKNNFQIISLPKLGNGFVLTNSKTDPMEYDNLTGNKMYSDIENELKRTFFTWLLNTPLYYPKKTYAW
jgi:arylsulfatase A-like enzyme